MTPDRLDTIREGVLARMERAERGYRLGLYGAALAELGLIAVALFMADLGDRMERLVVVLAILSYSIIALGLVALGAHVSRSVGRVLVAMEAMGDASAAPGARR